MIICTWGLLFIKIWSQIRLYSWPSSYNMYREGLRVCGWGGNEGAPVQGCTEPWDRHGYQQYITLPHIKAFDKDPLHLLLTILLCNEETGIVLGHHMDIMRVLWVPHYLMLDTVVKEFATRLYVPINRITNTAPISSVGRLMCDRCRCAYVQCT